MLFAFFFPFSCIRVICESDVIERRFNTLNEISFIVELSFIFVLLHNENRTLSKREWMLTILLH